LLSIVSSPDRTGGTGTASSQVVELPSGQAPKGSSSQWSSTGRRQAPAYKFQIASEPIAKVIKPAANHIVKPAVVSVVKPSLWSKPSVKSIIKSIGHSKLRMATTVA
ncbi:hypothetical protein EC991_006474, partial [Linnemannia zychae]